MKILIPFITTFKIQTNSKGKVMKGGGDKFVLDIVDNFDAIYLEITKEIRNNNQTKRVIQDAITKHKPDMILLNNPYELGNVIT